MIPDDDSRYAGLTEYELRYLAQHLAESGRAHDLRSLLTDEAFVRAKVEAGQVLDLVRDYARAKDLVHEDNPFRAVVKSLEDNLGTAVLRAITGPEDDEVGLFSRLTLGELPLLAGREREVLKRYGERSADKRFEAQLASLVQSFGFYVVQARMGKRTVDLVCVSDHPSEPMTFLIEAKSSKDPYSLPAKDERALQEYVKETKRDLSCLPRLRFVLVVGKAAAPTLRRKLSLLQDEIQLPVRFCPICSLVLLRHSLPGPVLPAELAKSIMSGPLILSDSFAEAIAAAHRERQDALARLVRVFGHG